MNITKGDIALSGFVEQSQFSSFSTRRTISVFKPPIHKDKLMNPVYNAYESLIKRGEYPFFVINLLLPGDQVDVNVHPMKTEVRFKDEWRLFHLEI